MSMDKNLNDVALELFGKIRTQFPQVKLGNADSEVTDRPEDARFFEFSFKKHNVDLGSISISISEDDGLVVMFSNEMVEGQPETVKRTWFNFLRELREFGKQRLMNFSIRDINKSNLTKRDYQFLSTQQHGDSGMTESKLWGTSKTSYQRIGEARLVVKHSQPVNPDLSTGRAFNIESIYVENAQGERFKYPYKHLNGARAMAMHVSHGGTPYDAIGMHVTGLSEELNKLRMFKNYVGRNPMVSEAMGPINDKVAQRIEEVKKEIHSLQSSRNYAQFAESFEGKEEQEIPEDLVNDWIDRLTIRTFNEELKNVFPYIYKLVGEEMGVKELSAEDLLGEMTEEQPEAKTADEIAFEEFQQFEAHLDSIGQMTFEAPVEEEAVEEEEEPVAENRLVAAIRRTVEAGAQLTDSLEIGGQSFTLEQVIQHAGMQVEDFFGQGPDQAQEIVEFVKSMYDHTTGRFPKGETGVMLACEKEFGEAGAAVAQKVIAELQNNFESTRMKQLAGMMSMSESVSKKKT